MSYYAKRFFGQQQLPSGAILHYPLSVDAVDLSSQQNNGIVSGGVTFGGVADGNGVIKQCATFTNGAIATTKNMTPLSLTDKVTIGFWMRSTQSTVGIITELSANYNHNNAFVSTINELENVRISLASWANVYNFKGTNRLLNNDGSWKHVVLVIDRSLDNNDEIKIYINGIMQPLVVGYGLNNDQIGNFGLHRLFIGARNSNSIWYSGSLSNFIVYDRVLTNSEIQTLASI